MPAACVRALLARGAKDAPVGAAVVTARVAARRKNGLEETRGTTSLGEGTGHRVSNGELHKRTEDGHGSTHIGRARSALSRLECPRRRVNVRLMRGEGVHRTPGGIHFASKRKWTRARLPSRVGPAVPRIEVRRLHCASKVGPRRVPRGKIQLGLSRRKDSRCVCYLFR